MIDLLDVDKGALSHELAGTGQPVVLLHSRPPNQSMWDPQFETLAEQFAVLRYDQRGYGRSAAPTGDYSHAEDLWRLLHHVGMPRRGAAGIHCSA
jgi:pimeloyl-ACP methyl ester carboxylesterase